MRNSLGREVDFNPFEKINIIKNKKNYKITNDKTPEVINGFSDLFNKIEVKDNMTLSFHHHLRNGDRVLNKVMEYVYKSGVKDLTLAASSIFDCHKPIVKYIKEEVITEIHTSYMSGPVADTVSKGYLKKPAHITTHGGRARSILEKELKIDIAFVAAPSIDKNGAISGSYGESACGSLGYADSDCRCANLVVAITDNLCDSVENPDIEEGLVDYIVKIDKIGDPDGIVSGTTQITKDPLGLKIARNTAKVINKLGLIKDGFSFQTGAGGISLAVASEIKGMMQEYEVKGSFGSGGITGSFVDMLNQGLFKNLMDVQCFDKLAIESTKDNKKHIKISASKYANPNDDCVCEKLDCVVLGASEIDLDFNVNVTTGMDGVILGGSGGHADTASGAKVTIVTSKLFNSRISCIVDSVRTISTPGQAIDILVTDYGIAINPRRKDLLEKLKDDNELEIVSIKDLYDIAIGLTGKPKIRKNTDEVVAYSVYRDGTILDNIYKVKE